MMANPLAGDPKTFVILCSAPQSDQDGHPIMEELEAICKKNDRMICGYDWAGSSSAEPLDKDIDWKNPESVKTSRWFVGYRAKIKGHIMVRHRATEHKLSSLHACVECGIN
jgi:hypothetical protein